MNLRRILFCCIVWLAGFRIAHATALDSMRLHRSAAASLGIAGASASIADDSSAFYLNPAGLARKAEYRYFNLGYRTLSQFKNLGFNAALIDGKTEDPLTWGLLFNFARSKSEFQFQDYVFGTAYNYDNLILLGFTHRLTKFQHKRQTPDHWSYGVNAGILIFALDWLAIGASADNLYRYFKNSSLTPFVYRGGLSVNLESFRAAIDIEKNHSAHKSYAKFGVESRQFYPFLFRAGFYSDSKRKDLAYTLGTSIELSPSFQINVGVLDQLKSSDFAYLTGASLRF